MDGNTKKLAQQVESLKKHRYNIVFVTVKGIVINNPEGAPDWEEILTITEIISVVTSTFEVDKKFDKKDF